MTFPAEIPCQTVMESIADGVFTVDMDWRVTSFNQAAETITGVPAAEALGRKCWEVFHSSLCDGGCALRQCLQNDTRLVNKSIFIIRPDGTRVPVSISAAPLRDASGKLLGGVETFRDLTDITLLRREVEGRFVFEDMVGKSAPMLRLFGILPQIAASEATTLVSGESGVGKELVARAIHNLSPRAAKPFVAVNCGALPETLLESELFGYKAGAFTDAKRDKPGRFQAAAGGSIFLDEIGDMPPGLQVKLLRVLQEKSFEPLGSVTPVKTDVRVIAATNHDLDELTALGGFRQDLFYRLNVVQLRIPPLRERPEDIPPLARHFIRRFNLLKGKAIQDLSEDALALLLRHPFPGNARELENILEFAFILCPGDFIQVEHLPERMRPGAGQAGADAALFAAPLTMERIKCLAVRQALARHSGKVMAACRELGVSKDTLRRLRARCAQLGE